MAHRLFLSAFLTIAVALTQAAPGFAHQSVRKPSKTRTIVKWTLIGAGIGAAAGFGLGFRAYDDARFAERKITQAAIAGAAIGAGGGWVIGKSRAATSAAPATKSLWTPASPLRRTSDEKPPIAYRSIVFGIGGPVARK